MQSISSVIESISTAVWGWPMIILLLGTHIFMTIRLRFPQLSVGKAIRLSITKDKHSHGDVSQFGALATALAATIGTGNIVGVATAVALGGPGAVLWCWITGVFGMATKYSEGLLAVKYRVKTKDGRILGGPMFALERGLHAKWLAILFAVVTAIAAFGIGNTVQANSISLLLSETYGISQYLIGVILAVLVLLVIVFGVKGIAKVCSTLVPFMAAFYVLGCLVILGMNWPYLGESIRLICRSAFTARAAGGGFVGSTVLIACRFGIARGLFSNESGLGSAPIVAAAAQTRNPVRQALVSSTGTFWDTVVVCAITGLVLVSSIVAHPDIDCTQGAALTHRPDHPVGRHRHFRLLDDSRLVVLWRTRRRIPGRTQSEDSPDYYRHLPHPLRGRRLLRLGDEPLGGLEPGRYRQRDDGDSEPDRHPAAQRGNRTGNPEISVGKPARRGKRRDAAYFMTYTSSPSL